MKRLKGLLKSFLKSSATLFYPPLCLHCEETALKGFFCENCLKQLEMLSLEGRCMRCFSPDLENKKGVCHECCKSGPILDRCVAVFDYYGPSATLIKKMKYAGQAYLAKGAAAYMAAQFVQLEMEWPDALIPVPMPFMRKMERGYNQSALLAKELSAIINKPVLDCLTRATNPYRQVGMNKQQRLEQVGDVVFKGGEEIREKRVLLIDDVYTTGGTMHACAEAVWGGFPERVEALVLCRGI